MTLGILVGLLVAGALLALDEAAVGQFLLARPLVAATLGGALAGDPLAGALAGLLLEGVYLALVPTGGVRLPEAGPGSLVAGAVASGSMLAGATPAGALALGLSLGGGISLVGGALVARHRARNARAVARAVARGESLGRPLRGALLRGAARGAGLVAAGLGLAVLTPASLLARWPLPLEWTVALLALPSLLGLGALGRIPLPGPSGRGPLLLAGGTMVGLLAGWVLGLSPRGGMP